MKTQEILKQELQKFMHEMIRKNKSLVEQDDYSNLLSLCEQDITILACISGKEEVTAKAISASLAVPKTTIVSAVARLEQRGYIQKEENVSDRREKFLVLTAKGIKANEEHMRFENLILESLVGLWSEADQKKVVTLLQCRKELI